MTTTVFALLGATALYLIYAWLGSAIIAAYLSNRKGYGERPGLASGLLLNAIGIIVWLVMPAKEESLWKTVGPFGSTVKGEQRAMTPGTPDAPDPTPPDIGKTGKP
ncbi:MAG TPA: hypothetical protein VM266_12395 [Solirubrobacteraceae bacterium]|nr:hypothetical protein [Solirubrobacteraceae bacterium]